MRDKTALARAFDTVFGFLMRPRVRRLRRWSFLVTLPGAVIAAKLLEIHPTFGTGLKAGIAAAILDTVLVLLVGVLGARVLGRERRDVLLDFLMHPMARRAVAGEIRTLLVVPLALWRRLRRPRWREFAYHRGSNELGLARAPAPPRARRPGARGGGGHLPERGSRRPTDRVREPVPVKRALRDPVAVSRLVVAVDDAEGLVEEVGRAQGLAGTEVRQRSRLLGWLAPADLLEAVTA